MAPECPDLNTIDFDVGFILEYLPRQIFCKNFESLNLWLKFWDKLIQKPCVPRVPKSRADWDEWFEPEEDNSSK